MSDAQSKIAMHLEHLQSASPLSAEYCDALDSLLEAVSEDAIDALDSFQMPVYKSTGSSELVYTITKSTKSDGKFQVTRFSKTGALGDSQYSNIRSLISSEGLAYSARRLGNEEAIEVLQSLMEAEAQYQSKKVRAEAFA